MFEHMAHKVVWMIQNAHNLWDVAQLLFLMVIAFCLCMMFLSVLFGGSDK